MKNNFRIFSSLLLASATLLLFSFQFASKEKWVKHSSGKGNFSIQFPCEPEESEVETNGVITSKINCSYAEELFFVGFTIHQTDLSGNEAALQQSSVNAYFGAMKGASEHIDSPWKVKKHAGIASVIKFEEGSGIKYMEYRVLIIGNTQFQLVYTVSADINTKKKNVFFKSFVPNG